MFGHRKEFEPSDKDAVQTTGRTSGTHALIGTEIRHLDSEGWQGSQRLWSPTFYITNVSLHAPSPKSLSSVLLILSSFTNLSLVRLEITLGSVLNFFGETLFSCNFHLFVLIVLCEYIPSIDFHLTKSHFKQYFLSKMLIL